MEGTMIKNFHSTLQPFKFRLTVFGLLSGATVLCFVLFRLRIMLSDSTDYVFLVWNLFLAWIPLGMAYFVSFAKKRRYVLITVPLAAALWLLFLPNAPYILTDLQHLRHPYGGVPIWFDMLLINWFAWTGLLLGIFSLFLMHDIVRRMIGRWAGWFFVLSVSLLSGLGIYLGRFLRWNSWDLILRPLELPKELIQYMLNPPMQAVGFISIFSAFFIFIYVTVYAFGLLFHEQAHLNPISQEIT
jgi:uncharacterized membrane protein